MHIWQFFEPLFGSRYSIDQSLQSGWWMLAMPLLAAVLLGNGLLFLIRKKDRKKRAMRTLVLCTVVVVGADVTYYLEAAYRRATVSEKNCHVSSPSPYGSYDAVVCVTDGTGADATTAGFVRLRSTQDGSILAERAFYNPSFHDVYWRPEHLTVGIGDGSAWFELPPSSWDRLLARLP